MVQRAYKFRLYLSEPQKGSLAQAFGCARFVYNHFLAARSAKNTELTLSQRRWRCMCGVEHDRDTNAARNLLLAGLAATGFSTAGLAGR